MALPTLIIIALLILAVVFLVLGFFLPQRTYLWIASLACAVLAVLIKVFAGGV